jgi:energy-coupling factor transporter ATP-binding protein EcfA2
MTSETPASEDLLERQALANKIVKTIKKKFEENKGVRIGVHGEWGSGKSTLLNFLEKQLTETKEKSIEFNTKEYDCLYNSRSSFDNFHHKIKPYEIIKFDLSEYDSIDDFGNHFNKKLLKIMPFNLLYIIRLILLLLIPIIQWKDLISFTPSLKFIDKSNFYIYGQIFYYFILGHSLYKIRAIFCKWKFSTMVYTFCTSFLRVKTGRSLESLEKFLGLSENELEKITNKNNLVIIIDEIDRSKPQVIHDVLLRLKQVMDIDSVKNLPIAFILSFDRSIVIKSIEGHNKAYENNGEFFLEKIIEFDYDLGKLESDLIENMLESKLKLHLHKGSIIEIINVIAGNPRKIKATIKDIEKAELDKKFLFNGSIEIDKNNELYLVVLFCVLKNLSSKFFNDFFDFLYNQIHLLYNKTHDSKDLENFLGNFLKENFSENDKEKYQHETKDKILSLIKRIKELFPEKQLLNLILKQIFTAISYAKSPHSFIFHRKDNENLINTLNKNSNYEDDIDNYITKVRQETLCSKKTISYALFDWLLDYYIEESNDKNKKPIEICMKIGETLLKQEFFGFSFILFSKLLNLSRLQPNDIEELKLFEKAEYKNKNIFSDQDNFYKKLLEMFIIESVKRKEFIDIILNFTENTKKKNE